VCYNCVLVNTPCDVNGACRFKVAQIFLIFSVLHHNKEYPYAFVQWYSFIGTEPDEDTGCWIVEPDIGDGESPHIAVIHIVKAAMGLDSMTCTKS